MSTDDLPSADRIFKLAFGTEFGIPDPMTFRGDAGLVVGRFFMYPDGCFVADIDGQIVGFSIANRWGSAGFLGPVCIHPDYWGQGIARLIVQRCVTCFDQWGCTASGLFTDGSSPRHLRLYQAFGYWPRQLTIVTSRKCDEGSASSEDYQSLLGCEDREAVVMAVGNATDLIYPGLDLRSEIEGVLSLGHGDLLFRHRDGKLDFALCHFGAGSEGGSPALYVKFAQIASGEGGALHFERLLAACLARARELKIERVVAGVNTRQHAAYKALLQAGFRADMHGVRMNRPYGDLLDEATSYSLGDWR